MIKVSFITQSAVMAKSPVDRNSYLMEADFGTKCLITDPAADKYLNRAKEKKAKTVPEDSYSRWCGGSGGSDLFV